MITNEIDELLSNIHEFIGTFACNKIPHVKQRPAFLIINTAPLPKKVDNEGVIQGKHWVAIRLSRDEDNEYFDSFGFPPKQQDIVNYLSSCGKLLEFNTQQLQDTLSDVCGAYCVDYVRNRAHGIGFKQYLGSFGHDPLANDKAVVNRVTWQS
jgi:hypothetical protein